MFRHVGPCVLFDMGSMDVEPGFEGVAGFTHVLGPHTLATEQQVNDDGWVAGHPVADGEHFFGLITCELSALHKVFPTDDTAAVTFVAACIK